MEYKFGEGEVIAETLRRTTLRDGDGVASEVCVASLVAMKGPMSFRAVGGDDHEMLWHRLEVVPPPLVESLELTLAPPAYSGRPLETLPAGVGHVRGLVGTQVHLKATTNKPLQSANLRVKDQPPLADPAVQQRPEVGSGVRDRRGGRVFVVVRSAGPEKASRMPTPRATRFAASPTWCPTCGSMSRPATRTSPPPRWCPSKSGRKMTWAFAKSVCSTKSAAMKKRRSPPFRCLRARTARNNTRWNTNGNSAD